MERPKIDVTNIVSPTMDREEARREGGSTKPTVALADLG
jgi:hypothetical protein